MEGDLAPHDAAFHTGVHPEWSQAVFVPPAGWNVNDWARIACNSAYPWAYGGTFGSPLQKILEWLRGVLGKPATPPAAPWWPPGWGKVEE
jgi:hypothetical protein